MGNNHLFLSTPIDKRFNKEETEPHGGMAIDRVSYLVSIGVSLKYQRGPRGEMEAVKQFTLDMDENTENSCKVCGVRNSIY